MPRLRNSWFRALRKLGVVVRVKEEESVSRGVIIATPNALINAIGG